MGASIVRHAVDDLRDDDGGAIDRPVCNILPPLPDLTFGHTPPFE